MTTPIHTLGGIAEDYQRKSAVFMASDLARSGLTADVLGCTADTLKPFASKEEAALVTSSYLIPYYDFDGRESSTMWRRRRAVLPGAERWLGKYVQPSVIQAGVDGYLPYMLPKIWKMDPMSGDLHICEGEKKAASLIHLAGRRAVGIGGKDVSDEGILNLCRCAMQLANVKHIYIWPDADVIRYDISRSYGRLAERLTAGLKGTGIEISVCKPIWGEEYKGIDDALAAGWPLPPEADYQFADDLPIDIRPLAERLGCSYSLGARGDRFSIHLNDDNMHRLLSYEPLWGRFWLNTDTQMIHLDDEEEEKFSLLTARVTRSLQSKCGLVRVQEGLVDRQLSVIAEENAASPWADWLRGIEWDGVRRLDTWLQDYAGAEPPYLDDASGEEYLHEISSKFLISCVARTLETDETKVDWMLILCGPQGCGKSSIAKALMPPMFRGLVRNDPAGAQDKDLMMAAASCRVLLFDELSRFFGRADNTSFIKQFVSQTVDTFRPPYGRDTVNYRRGCVLMGTTDQPEAIRADSAGYRRWAVVDVRGTVPNDSGLMTFKFAELEEVRVQLWAEAVARWRTGGVDYSNIRGAGAAAVAAAHVIEPEEWDNYLPVLKGIWNARKLSGSARDMDGVRRRGNGENVWLRGFSVLNSEFALAYQQVWGREPRAMTLRAWWDAHKCPSFKANGRRGRIVHGAMRDLLEADD